MRMGLPTGMSRLPPNELYTPANDVYQATRAVMIPITPPVLMMPLLFAKLPMNNTISVSSRVRNTATTAALTRVAASSMYVLKMANASRIQPLSFDGLLEWTRIAYRPSPIQNPPYDENAVAPNVLPLRNSHMPASSWHRPP